MKRKSIILNMISILGGIFCIYLSYILFHTSLWNHIDPKSVYIEEWPIWNCNCLPRYIVNGYYDELFIIGSLLIIFSLSFSVIGILVSIRNNILKESDK